MSKEGARFDLARARHEGGHRPMIVAEQPKERASVAYRCFSRGCGQVIEVTDMELEARC